MYRNGIYPETPPGVSDEGFKSKVRKWYRTENLLGPESLKHKNTNKEWNPDEKLELVSQVIAGKSCLEVALCNGINEGQLYQWVRKYKELGYNGLVNMKKGRPSKEPQMKKKVIPTPLTESEREELIRLRAEVEYMKAENEVIKKEIALREERQAAQLKAKKQRSSKNLEKKESN